MKQKRRPNSICSCIYLGQLTGRYNMCKIKTSKLTGARVHLSVCLYDDNSSTGVKHLAYSVEGIPILSLLSKTITIVCQFRQGLKSQERGKLVGKCFPTVFDIGKSLQRNFRHERNCALGFRDDIRRVFPQDFCFLGKHHDMACSSCVLKLVSLQFYILGKHIYSFIFYTFI